MNKVQFTDTNTGRLVTFTGLNEEQTVALVAFARTLGEETVVQLRVRTPQADRTGLVWANITDRY